MNNIIQQLINSITTHNIITNTSTISTTTYLQYKYIIINTTLQ